MDQRYEFETWPVVRPSKDLSHYTSKCYSTDWLKSYGPLLFCIKNFLFAFFSGLKVGYKLICTLLVKALIGLKSVTGDLKISI